MAFHIDYRPNDFSEMVGNEDLILSLQTVLEQENHPHVYLFSGETGCGKTTLARIIAKKLECSVHDILEINSSNNRGIDTARDLISQIYLKPLGGKNKIYILDEVHSTTKDFQHAILKVLEDTPPHVYFILCTTNTEKLLSAILSRCCSFVVEKLNNKLIIILLKKILSKMEIEYSVDILREIARKSDGIPRQALIMLQQIINLKNEKQILNILSSFKTEKLLIIDLCRALLKKNWKEISIILKSLKNDKIDSETIRYTVLGYFSSVLLNSRNETAALILECFSNNTYDSRFSGIILYCYQVCFS